MHARRPSRPRAAVVAFARPPRLEAAPPGGARPLTPAHDPIAALRNPFVRRYAVGRVATVMAGQIISVAVGWDLYERTHDAWALGLVGVLELAPVLVLMFPAGIAADRYPRRNIAMFAQATLALAALGLVVASWQQAAVPVIYAILVLVGVARAFAAPSMSTIMPQLLEPAELANANAWLSSSFELAAITGPAVGGAVIAATGGAMWAYVLAALGPLVMIAMLSTLPAKAPPPAEHHASARDMFAGVRFIRRNPVFLAAITLDLFAVLLGGAVALLPIFAKDILHVGPAGLGVLRAAPSAGALVMALIATRLPPWRQPGKVLLGVVAGFGIATIGFGLSTSLALSLACLFFTGVFDAVSVVIRLTLEQVITPYHLRGRVSSVNFVFIGFSNEFGTFESGATAALFGPVASVVGGGVGTLLVVGAVMGLWPQLSRIGALHTLRPGEAMDAARGAVSEASRTAE
jgi:MFS family permease